MNLKTILKHLTLLFLLILNVFAFVACGKKEEEKENKIIDSPDTVELGESIVLSNSIDNENAIWSIDDEEIASIEDRKLTGLKIGECALNCTIGSDYYTINFKVIAPIIDISISGKTSLVAGSSIKLSYTLSKPIPSIDSTTKVTWSSSDKKIAIVNENGEVTGTSKGTVIITASVYNNKKDFEVTILDATEKAIVIDKKSELVVNDSFEIDCYIIGVQTKEYEVISSDVSVAKILNGYIIGVGVGTCTITARLINDHEVNTSFTLNVIKTNILMELKGDKSIEQGKYDYLTPIFTGDKVESFNKALTWESSDNKVAIVEDGIVLGVNKGTVTITATSVEEASIKASFSIEVTKYVAKDIYSDSDKARVQAIMDNMSLDQKLGQMFFIGFNDTKYNDTLKTVIENYHFGNIIYMGHNVTKPETLADMSNAIQTKMVEENGVPAFISTDQEGGSVARLKTQATHFVSNMAVCATGNVENSYEMGKACGFELKNYGINMDLAPVLDVNNNPENPVIGIRSYSDSALKVSLYGNGMYQGLETSGVVGCVKHFPGHGNTNTDSHTGLPVISSSKDELYQTELAPFIASISNGVGAIMTTHILFTAIDEEYPATLSYKVLTELLREELGYTGLIITDGMGMAGVNQFGTVGEVAVQAVQAGIDIFCYTSNDTPRTAFDAIIQAYYDGIITEERINASVRRILLAKLHYGVLDDYIVEKKDISEELAKNAALNYKMGEEAVTLVKGSYELKKTDKILIISVTCSYTLDKVDGKTLDKNSLACYCATYLKSKGFENAESYTTSNPITTKQANELKTKVLNYDKVIIAFANVKSLDEKASYNFVNAVSGTLGDKLLMVALRTPYDLLAYQNVKNYVCLYTNQNATIVGFAKYLAGEIEANGVLPIDKNLFN